MSDVKVIDIDGLKLVYAHTNVNNEFCLMPYFKTGAIDETDDNCGITHFLEHMFAKQTTNLSEKQMLKTLQLYLPKYNAFTSFEKMALMCTTSIRYQEKMFAFFGDVIQNAVFTDERAKKESKVIEQEICKYDVQNDAIADDNIIKVLYDYPFAKNKILGTKENVLRTTGADLTSRYKILATKENMFLSYAGASSEEEVVRLVKKYFNNVPSNTNTKLNPPNVTINGKEQVYIQKKEDDTVSAIIALRCNFDESDKKQRQLSIILAHYFNDQGHPMWNEMREKQSLVYGYYSYIRTIGKSSSIFFEFETTKSNIKKCIKTYAKILTNLYNKGLTKKYFEEIKEAYKIVLDGKINVPYLYCNNNAKSFLNGYEFEDTCDIIDILDSLSVEDFNAFIKNVCKCDFVGASLVGNISKRDMYTIDELKTLFYK